MSVLLILAIVIIVYNLLKEGLEKPAPKGTYFDWDEYWKDVENGMSAMEQVRKRERGGYDKVKPK